MSECDLPVLQDLHCDVSYLLREIRNAVHGTLPVCGETTVARRLTMAAGGNEHSVSAFHPLACGPSAVVRAVKHHDL